jgi:hypothetical protein
MCEWKARIKLLEGLKIRDKTNLKLYSKNDLEVSHRLFKFMFPN